MTKSELYLKALIKKEVKKLVNEAAVVTPPVIKTSPIGKYKLREEDQVDPQIEDELEKTLADAAKKFASDMAKVGKEAEQKLKDEDEVEQVLQKNPEIEKLAKESVSRRRGKSLNEKESLNEELLSLSFLVGLALAIPSIVGLIGTIVKMIETKLGSKTEMGDKLKHIGHDMHEGIIKYLTSGLKLIPGFSKLKPETQKKIATVVHIVIVAYLAIHSGGVAIESVKSGLEAANVSTAAIEGALAAVKSGEVASFLKKTILATVGG